MRRRFLLVNNPTAGRGRHERVASVVQELTKRGCSVTALSETEMGVLDDAERLGKYDAVIGAGGDGTIRKLIDTEAGQAIPLGLIPNGTGNVLAHEIGVRLRPVVIADVLIAGPEQAVLSATFSQSHFLLMLGVGFDGMIIHHLNSRLKEQIGKAAYVWPVLRALGQPFKPFSVVVDGTSYVADWAIIANARRYGGNFMLVPQAGVTKPPFHVVVFQASSKLVRLRQLLSIAMNRFHMAPETKIVSGKQIRFNDVPAGVLAQADGDPLPSCPAEISYGRSVRLIVPNRFLR